jgi:transcription antitermination factor NusG
MRPTSADDFKPGDAVIIDGGAFDLYRGTVTGRDGDKILVDVIVFGRPCGPVIYDPYCLRHDPEKR